MTNRATAYLPLALAALLFAACHGESPTEPASPAAAKSLTTEAGDSAAAGEDAGGRISAGRARAIANDSAGRDSQETTAADDVTEAAAITAAGHGNGGGGNGGGSGGGNGGGNGGGHGGALSLGMQPDVWNTNFEHAGGTVSALVRGGDAMRIDPATVLLVGDAGTASPQRVQTSGGQLRAFFSMSDAWAVLTDPDPGETHDVHLTFTVTAGGTSTSGDLATRVRIVGPRGGDDDDGEVDIDLSVQPNAWNTNWTHANGTVSAVLRGDIADVDVDSIVLVGDDATAAVVHPVDARRTGNHVRARFRMSEAFDSLDDPDPGEVHVVTIRFNVAGTGGTSTAMELTARVRIVGPATSG